MLERREAVRRPRSALIVAHPGHELRVHAWLEQARPTSFVLTQGDGAAGVSRLPSTTAVLTRAGAPVGVAALSSCACGARLPRMVGRAGPAVPENPSLRRGRPHRQRPDGVRMGRPGRPRASHAEFRRYRSFPSTWPAAGETGPRAGLQRPRSPARANRPPGMRSAGRHRRCGWSECRRSRPRTRTDARAVRPGVREGPVRDRGDGRRGRGPGL